MRSSSRSMIALSRVMPSSYDVAGRLAGAFSMPWTAGDVIVHEAGGLHERVHDGRPDEPESALLQILAQRARLVAFGGKVFTPFNVIIYGLPADEMPDIRIEGSELFLDFLECLRVAHG